MYDSDRAFRQYERFLFLGVPEQPESLWERDIHAQADDRYTGKSQHIVIPEYYGLTEEQLIPKELFQSGMAQVEVIWKSSEAKE